MRKTIPKLLTLMCLLAALMAVSIVTAHAATVTGTVSSGNEYRYHEDKTPVSQWGGYTSTKLKYFTPSGGGSTVPAYCMEPSVGSASGDLSYSSVSWSSLRTDQRYAITLAMAYGYGGAYSFGNIHPDCAQLATQAVIWEFVCDYRSTTYPYTLYDTTCAELFHYAGDGVEAAYDILICNIDGVTISQNRYTLTVTATKAAAAQLDGYITSDQGYSLDVTGDEAVLLEPSNGSNYQACTALTVVPDPVVAYIHFAVNAVPDTGSLTINKVDADTGKPLAGVTYRLLNADGTKVADVTTDSSGKAVFSDLPLGDYFYQEISAPEGYVLDSTRYAVTISTTALNVTEKRTNTLAKGSLEILKVDADTKQPLAGVVYRLFDNNGSKIAEGTTDGSGKVTFSGLKPGSYSYQEVSTVDGYLLDETRYEFSLTSGNLNIKATRENTPIKGSITIQKVDALGAPLAGAELVLEMSTDGQTWTEVSRKTTGADGLAKWDDLKLGTQYRITEVKAPAGYILLTEPVALGTLTADTPDITVTLCNNVGFVLPFTGGHGFIVPILFATLMLGMGAYFYRKFEMKKETN